MDLSDTVTLRVFQVYFTYLNDGQWRPTWQVPDCQVAQSASGHFYNETFKVTRIFLRLHLV